MKRLIFISLAVCGAIPAMAQISSVGAFSGVSSEGFESYETYQNSGRYGTMNIMGGAATINSLPISSQKFTGFDGSSATWGLVSVGFANVFAGERAIGLEDVVTFSENHDWEMIFTDGATEFGGYFSTSSNAPVTVRFFDSSNNQIGGDQSIDNPSADAAWFGWSSTVAIARAEFLSTGSYMTMDELQVNSVPEPATMAILGLGAAALIGRRRK